MDFLQKNKGQPIYILVVTDHFTWYMQAYVTMNQTVRPVTKEFIDKFVGNYGWLEKILIDQAQTFEGKLFKKLCDVNITVHSRNQWSARTIQ